MKRIPLLFALVCLTAVSAYAQDPVKTEPSIYKVEFENEEVRIIRVRIEPGHKGTMHEHPNHIIVAVTDITTRHTLPDGKAEERSLKAGQSLYMPAGKHAPEAMGSAPQEVLLIELKSPPHSKDKGKH